MQPLAGCDCSLSYMLFSSLPAAAPVLQSASIRAHQLAAEQPVHCPGGQQAPSQPPLWPFSCRPNEGSVRFNVEFSPMASPNFDAGRPGEAAIELARLVERSLRETRAIDQEALCVLAGRKVRVRE